MMARVKGPIGIAASWLTAATLGYTLALGTETFRHLGGAGSRAGEVAYIGELAILMTLLCSLPLAALHLIATGLDRLWPERKPGVEVTALIVTVAAALPAWDQADFLTSGAGAEELVGDLETFKLGVAGTLVLLQAGLWLWHFNALRDRTHRWLLRVPRELRVGFWYVTGLVFLAGLIYVLSFELKAYAFFAGYLLLPTWFVAATLAFRLVEGRAWHPGAAAGALGALWGAVGVLALSSGPELDRARTTYMRRGMVAALTDLRVYPSNTELASFAIDDDAEMQCHPHPATRPLPPLDLEQKQRRNVILISVDAMRADALDYKVGQRTVMPSVRRFRKQGVDFRRAVTTYPATLLAMGGALTGLNSSQLLFAPKVPPNIFALTRGRFARQYISLPKSKWFKRKIAKRLLLQQGKVERNKNAKGQVSWLLKQLQSARSKRQSVLAWIHLYEPHAKYKTRKGFDFGDSESQRYMSELAYVDKHLGRLLRYLERNHWYRDTMVILFSDHGEAMGERDYFGHHVYLNSWITDIPMIVRAPRLRPRVSHELVDVTDVAVSVLQFKGLDAPYYAEGISLLAPEGDRAGRVSFAEAFPSRGKKLFKLATKPTRSLKSFKKRVERVHRGARNYLPKVSAVTSEHRLIVNRVTGVQELYDRRNDPGEIYDLSWDGLPVHDWLRTRMRQWSARQGEQLYCEVLAAQKAKAARAKRLAKKKKEKKKAAKGTAAKGAPKPVVVVPLRAADAGAKPAPPARPKRPGPSKTSTATPQTAPDTP